MPDVTPLDLHLDLRKSTEVTLSGRDSCYPRCQRQECPAGLRSWKNRQLAYGCNCKHTRGVDANIPGDIDALQTRSQDIPMLRSDLLHLLVVLAFETLIRGLTRASCDISKTLGTLSNIQHPAHRFPRDQPQQQEWTPNTPRPSPTRIH